MMKAGTYGKVLWLSAMAVGVSPFIFTNSAQAQTPVTVTVDTKNVGAKIEPDFVGLSYESSAELPSASGAYFFSATNTALVQMFRTLGVKSLRVGGNTADRATVNIPDTKDIDSLFGFAKAAGVKVIYTVRMDGGDPAADAKLAKYIMEHYRADLSCFTIGNEPNHYFTNYPSYNEGWKKFMDDITGAEGAPDAVFCGPSFTPKNPDWAADFAKDHAHDPHVAFITQHEYPGGSGRTATNIVKAQDKLLSPELLENYEKFHDRFVPTVRASGFGYRLEECNNYSNGGAVGTSDSFTAALWCVDYMYWWAEHGAWGLNFHGSGFAPGSTPRGGMNYTALHNSATGYFARPLSYGMKMFGLGSNGRLTPAEVAPGASEINLRAYAVLADDGSLCVTLINKEHGAGGHDALVTLKTGNHFAHGSEITLNAPNGDVGAKKGLTLGGSGISDDGTWHGEWTDLAAPSADGQFTVKLPATTVAVVRLN
jgi:hypothetical protein